MDKFYNELLINSGNMKTYLYDRLLIEGVMCQSENKKAASIGRLSLNIFEVDIGKVFTFF